MWISLRDIAATQGADVRLPYRWPGPVVRDDAYWRQWVRAMAAMDIGVKKRRALLLEVLLGHAVTLLLQTP